MTSQSQSQRLSIYGHGHAFIRNSIYGAGQINPTAVHGHDRYLHIWASKVTFMRQRETERDHIRRGERERQGETERD